MKSNQFTTISVAEVVSLGRTPIFGRVGGREILFVARAEIVWFLRSAETRNEQNDKSFGTLSVVLSSSKANLLAT